MLHQMRDFLQRAFLAAGFVPKKLWKFNSLLKRSFERTVKSSNSKNLLLMHSYETKYRRQSPHIVGCVPPIISYYPLFTSSFPWFIHVLPWFTTINHDEPYLPCIYDVIPLLTMMNDLVPSPGLASSDARKVQGEAGWWFGTQSLETAWWIGTFSRWMGKKHVNGKC